MSAAGDTPGEAGETPGLASILGSSDPLGALGSLLQRAQSSLAAATVTGSAGGGAVQVVMSGERRLTGITIDPELLTAADAGILQELILAAANDAYERAEKVKSEAIDGLTAFGP